MDSEFDYGIDQHNEGRANQSIIIDTGKHANIITNCALVCGACLAISIVCAGICWWTITENRVTQERLQTLTVEHEVFKEQRNARN